MGVGGVSGNSYAASPEVTGLLFGVYHASPWVVPSAIFLGVVYGLAAARTGSIVPSTLAHAVNNAIAVTAGFVLLGRPEWTSRFTVALGVLAVGFVVAALVFSRLTRDLPREAPLLTAVPAAVAGRASFWFKVAAVPIVLFVALTLFLFVREVYPYLDLRTVETSALEPQLRRGDHVVLIRPRDEKDAQKLGIVMTSCLSHRAKRRAGSRAWFASTASACGSRRRDSKPSRCDVEPDPEVRTASARWSPGMGEVGSPHHRLWPVS